MSSEAGIKGLAKKIFILFLVALAEQLDIVLGTNLVRDGAVIAFHIDGRCKYLREFNACRITCSTND